MEPIDFTQTSANRHYLTAWKSEELIYNASEVWKFTRLQVVSIWAEFFHSERARRWVNRTDSKFLPYSDVTPQNKVNLAVTLRKIPSPTEWRISWGSKMMRLYLGETQLC